jgi:hypothetical protein
VVQGFKARILRGILSPFGGAREEKIQRDAGADYEKYFDTDYTD